MFAKTSMKISRKVPATNGQGNVYEEIGAVDYFVPTLDEFGIQTAVKKDDNGQDMSDDDGLPIYADDKADFLFTSLVQYVKASVRNKLVPGTVELKPNNTIPTNWEQFLAESAGRGEALKIIAEAKKAFASYVQGLSKSPQIKSAIIGLFSNKQALSLQSEKTKNSFLGYVAEFLDGLSEGDAERYGRYLTSLEEACKTESIELE